MDYVITIVIYIIVLAVVLWQTFSYPMTSDRLREYQAFLRMVEEQPVDRAQPHINYCLMVTLVPYIIYRVFNFNALKTFRVTPMAVWSLTPSFTYLTSRLWVSEPYALLVAGLMMANMLYHHSDSLGRNACAIGALSGTFWAMMSEHFWPMFIFIVILIISHYGITYLVLFILGGGWLAHLFIGIDSLYISSSLVVLLAGIIIRRTDLICNNNLRRFLSKHIYIRPQAIVKIVQTPERPILVSVPLTGEYLEAVKIGPQIIPSVNSVLVRVGPPWLKKLRVKMIKFLSQRDTTLQIALGFTLPQLAWYDKIQFITSWLVLIALHMSLVSLIIEEGLSLWAILGIFSYIAIWLTILLPLLSLLFSIIRTYIASSVFLFPILARWLPSIPLKISVPVLIIHLLLVSGVVSYWMGEDKHRHYKRDGAEGRLGVM